MFNITNYFVIYDGVIAGETPADCYCCNEPPSELKVDANGRKMVEYKGFQIFLSVYRKSFLMLS